MRRVKQLIKKIPFLYTAARWLDNKTGKPLRHELRKRTLHRHGKKALHALSIAFEEANVQWFLVYGTLLGAVREKDFISHDIDIDIGLFAEEFSPKTEEILKRHGFRKAHEYLVDEGAFAREETYEYKKISIDLFYFKKLPSGARAGYDFVREERLDPNASSGRIFPRESIFEIDRLERIFFKGLHIPVPSPPETFLRHHYGEDFMIKKPQWNYVNNAKNKKIVVDKHVVYRSYLDR